MAEKIRLKDSGFLNQVAGLSGETVTLCEQCGTCSGGCPFIAEMDITPSQIMRKVLLGDETVLESKAVWLCASCFTCTVRCPRGLDVSKVAEALRQMRLRLAFDRIDIAAVDPDTAACLPPIALVGAFRKLTG